MSNSTAILTGENLNAGYGKTQVLFDVSFKFKKKLIYAVVGPNGSGKSTFLKTIFGLTNVYNGSIKFNEKDITKMAPHEIAKLGIVYVPQVGNVFTSLSVNDNLIMAGRMLSREEKKVRCIDVIEMFPVLKNSLNRKTITLSGGERQMLAMAMGLLRKPQIMLIDEPTAHLAATVASEILEKIKECKKKLSITVVLVEQNTKLALEFSDYAFLLVNGRKMFSGIADELLKDPELGRIYLGL